MAPSIVPHNLDLQKARHRAEKSGWTEWARGERLSFKVSNRPDAVARDANGALVAIELERTVKTLKRYRQIMTAHLQQIKAEKWSRVEYVNPQESMVPRLGKIFRKIDYVLVSKQRVSVWDKHQAKFSFHHLARWPPSTQKNIKITRKYLLNRIIIP